jgi:hypothetical protein
VKEDMLSVDEAGMEVNREMLKISKLGLKVAKTILIVSSADVPIHGDLS